MFDLSLSILIFFIVDAFRRWINYRCFSKVTAQPPLSYAFHRSIVVYLKVNVCPLSTGELLIYSTSIHSTGALFRCSCRSNKWPIVNAILTLNRQAAQKAAPSACFGPANTWIGCDVACKSLHMSSIRHHRFVHCSLSFFFASSTCPIVHRVRNSSDKQSASANVSRVFSTFWMKHLDLVRPDDLPMYSNYAPI